MDNYYDLIGVRIKQYREAKGLSQEKLGELIDTSNRHLSKVETGVKYPSLELIIKIANALDITPDLLLTDYLSGSKETQNTELMDIFFHCNDTETAILMDMLKHLKALLSKYDI